MAKIENYELDSIHLMFLDAFAIIKMDGIHRTIT